MAIEFKNRSATFHFFITSTYQAGMVLTGSEIKSLRTGKVSFNDSYCLIDNNEVWLKSLHIAPYDFGNINNHDPLRSRKLLLKSREIKKIITSLKEKGNTLIPLRIFFSDKNLAKIEIGLGKGKKLFDKRASIKQKELDRDIKRFK